MKRPPGAWPWCCASTGWKGPGPGRHAQQQSNIPSIQVTSRENTQGCAHDVECDHEKCSTAEQAGGGAAMSCSTAHGDFWPLHMPTTTPTMHKSVCRVGAFRLQRGCKPKAKQAGSWFPTRVWT